MKVQLHDQKTQGQWN